MDTKNSIPHTPKQDQAISRAESFEAIGDPAVAPGDVAERQTASTHDLRDDTPRPQPGKSPFASMKVHHVAVRVPNFERALTWYVEKLDFHVLRQWTYADMQLAFIAPAEDSEFVIEILGGGNPPPIPKPTYSDLGDSVRLAGFHHFCINVLDLEAAFAELRRRDVTVVAEPFELPVINRRIAFIADPFGNIIELAQIIL